MIGFVYIAAFMLGAATNAVMRGNTEGAVITGLLAVASMLFFVLGRRAP